MTKILKRGEGYESVKTLYVISILDGYLKVNGEDKPLKDKLLRRAYLRMDEGSKILSDKLNFKFFAVTCGKRAGRRVGLHHKVGLVCQEYGEVHKET